MPSSASRSAALIASCTVMPAAAIVTSSCNEPCARRLPPILNSASGG
jgi:hypothetical protein